MIHFFYLKNKKYKGMKKNKKPRILLKEFNIKQFSFIFL